MTNPTNSLAGRETPLDRVQRRQRRAVRSTGESEGTLGADGGAGLAPTRDPASARGLGGPGAAVRSPATAERGGTAAPRRRATKPAPGRMPAKLSAEDDRLLAEIMVEPMDFMDHPDFHTAGAEKRIYEKAAPVRRPNVTWYRPMMDEIGVRNGESTPRKHDSVILTAAEERVIFMQFNYARSRVRMIQDKLEGRAPSATNAREMLRWHRLAQGYREQIAETNLALVLAMAKRVRLAESDFGDLISEGNMALMRAVDKFDCGRGFKFSTYACRAILKAFSRHGIKLSKYKQRFPTEFDPDMERSNHAEVVRETAQRDSAAEVRYIVESNRAELSEVEHAVIVHRFGLDRAVEARQPTLEQVGQLIGVTKERVRQIQNRALEKIRMAIEGGRPAAETGAPSLGAPSFN